LSPFINKQKFISRNTQENERLLSDKKDIAYQYYSSLYDTIKPYLSAGGAYYVMNQLYEVYQGFGDLAQSTSTDLQIRSDSYYKLYEMNKLLGDPHDCGILPQRIEDHKA